MGGVVRIVIEGGVVEGENLGHSVDFCAVMPLPKVLPQVQNRQQAPDQAARAPSGHASSRTAGWEGEKKLVVANRYSVEKKLGSGAFGTAFLVADKRSNNDRQVKL